MSASPYEPKYLKDVSKVPVAGPDEWDESEKLDKVETAESVLESDLNDGQEIPQTQVEDLHRKSVAVYATYLFGLSPSHPASVRAGQMPDGSRKQSRFATDMKELYESFKMSIQEAGSDSGSKDHTIVTA